MKEKFLPLFRHRQRNYWELTIKRWHPLPGATLRHRVKGCKSRGAFRLEAGSRLSTTVLCVPSMGTVQKGFKSPV